MTEQNQAATTQPLDRQAIQAALESRWDDAVRINLEFLSENPQDTATLNRLGIAHLKLNQPSDAKKYFQQVIDIDPYNSIAHSNLKKATPKYCQDLSINTPLTNLTFSFIEEPGKSKVIPLNNIGEPTIISCLYPGLEVELKVSARRLKVVTTKGHHHIGFLPDDISVRLIKLIRAGNKYLTMIKSSEPNGVQVYIKEVKSSKRLKGIPSFTSNPNLDKLEISSVNLPAQSPLEIYDPVTDESI